MIDKLIGARDEVKDDNGKVVIERNAGRMFRFDTLPVEEGFDLLGACFKNLGAPIVAAVMGGGLAGSIDATFAASINLPEVKSIIKKLLSTVSCLDASNVDSQGRPTGFVSLDNTFKGRYFELFTVAAESFKVNFADFLAEIQARQIEAKRKSSSPKPAI